MQDSSFLTEEWFWAAVAALAAIIGAFASWVISAIIKHREQPEADWAVMMAGHATTEEEEHSYGQEPGFHVTGRISNVGDGAAFHVQLEARNCQAGLSTKDTEGMSAKPFMPSGSVVSFWIEVPLDRWDESDVDIVWTVPPTRLKKKMRSSLAPKEFMKIPGVPDFDPKTGATFQRPLPKK